MFVWVNVRESLSGPVHWTPSYLNLDQVTSISVRSDIVAGFRVATVSLPGGGSLTVRLVDEDRTSADAQQAVERLTGGKDFVG